jgi:hypothetical protein
MVIAAGQSILSRRTLLHRTLSQSFSPFLGFVLTNFDQQYRGMYIVTSSVR